MSGNVVCKQCGAEYDREMHKSIVRDQDSFNCSCGYEIDSWSSSRWPSYTLVKPGDPAKGFKK